MYRFTLFVLQLLLLIILLTFIFTNPFTISLDIGNLKYTFSSNLFSVLLISFIFLLYLVFYLLFRSRLSFSKYLLKSKYKKIEKGYLHFVDAMIAIANKDNKTAIKSHKKMNIFLKNDQSLSLLLRSEVLKIENKYPELKNVYNDMIKSKKTETLGYRGLMEQNLKDHDYHHAFLYGERLFSLNPNIEKLYETLIFIAAKTKNWKQLIYISDKAYSKKIIGRELLNENKSIAFYEIAKINLSGNLKEATKNIKKALELRDNFPPYIQLYLELIEQSNNLAMLKKIIKKYWYTCPTHSVRSIITKIILRNNLDNLIFINHIIKNNRDREESKKLLIYFAIHNKKWSLARETIKGLIGPSPTSEICIFMADIELGENNDKQLSDSWIMRSENAADYSNTWVCKITNQTQDQWNSLSDSGYFNSLVFNSPKMIVAS